jgi:EAL and modified HD-GYP domain-containing signal transduction protein
MRPVISFPGKYIALERFALDMMVVPKPIFTASKNVEGYQLSFQVGNALTGQGLNSTLNLSVQSPFFEFINEIGLDVLTTNKTVFVPVSDIILASNIEQVCRADRSLVALLISNHNTLSEANLQRIIHFKKMGFKIAFRGFSDASVLEPFLPYADYIFAHYDNDKLMPVMFMVRSGGYPIKVIATDVDTVDVFNRTAALKIDYFRGRFYKTPALSEGNAVSPLQVNYLQLLNQVNSDDFDFEKFTKVVQRDPSLAIQFLKMVNSSQMRQEIKSLRHAAALVGQNEIKRWVTTAVTSSMSQEKPGEITRISLLRAKFCENMAGLFEMGVHKENLFLMGLFSVLDVVLEMPIEKALEMIIVPDSVQKALIGEENNFWQIYNFVKNYEYGDWMEVSRTALVYNLKTTDIFHAYNEALHWYGRLINMKIDQDDLDEE